MDDLSGVYVGVIDERAEVTVTRAGEGYLATWRARPSGRKESVTLTQRALRNLIEAHVIALKDEEG